MNVFTLCIRLACDSPRHKRLLRIRYWFTSNHIPFRFGCRPREASRLEAKTHEAEAGTLTRPRPRPRPQPTGRGRGRGQVFWPRGRGQASRPNIPELFQRQGLCNGNGQHILCHNFKENKLKLINWKRYFKSITNHANDSYSMCQYLWSINCNGVDGRTTKISNRQSHIGVSGYFIES